MQFEYEAIRSDGRTATATLDAPSQAEALDMLRAKGLLVTRVEARPGDSAAARQRRRASRWPGGRRLTLRDLILFSKQMKMLLESGVPAVPALQAAEEQTARPVLRQVLARVRERVEHGEALADALEPERQHFDTIFRSVVATGEATATLPAVFGQLAELLERQQQTRRAVVGAALYPAVLCVLLSGVIATLLLFVVPRFRILFTNLKSKLPPTTELLFKLSALATHYWPYAIAGIVMLVVAATLAWRWPALRARCDELVLRLPLVGRLVARLTFARVVRIWATMLRAHVPLLDALRESQSTVHNLAFRRLLDQIMNTVSSGGRMGQALATSGVTDPIVAAAIRTGEENGRIAEATDFVSHWLEEENTNAIHNLTRLAEPLLLAVMGVVVGFIAMALFVPLFDIAMAAG